MLSSIGRREFLLSSGLTAISCNTGFGQQKNSVVCDKIYFYLTSGCRKIEYRILGDTRLPPVVYFCGSPTTFYELDMCHSSLQLDRYCWIGINRPGTGKSTFDPKMTFDSFTEDIAQIFAKLKNDYAWKKFRILGYSGGGPFALSCGSLNQWVSRIAMVSSAPLDGAASSHNALRTLTRMSLNSPKLAKRVNRLFFYSIKKRGITNQQLNLGLRRCTLAQIDVDMIKRCQKLRRKIAHGVSYVPECGIDGIIHEYRLLACPWEINFNNISVPVDIWHGKLDCNSPYQNSIKLHNKLPNSNANFLSNEGHLTIWIRRFPEILSKLHS